MALVAGVLLSACNSTAGPAVTPSATLPPQPLPASPTLTPPTATPTATVASTATATPAKTLKTAVATTAPAKTLETAAPTPAAAATATTFPSPSPATSPTAAAPVAVVTGDVVNIRSGPGTAFAVVGEATAGERFAILARAAASDWWRIDLGGEDGWIAGALVRVEGDPAQIVVQQDLPTPPPDTAQAGVQVSMGTVTIPTYPWEAFTEPALNPELNWTYRRLNRASYDASNPQPVPKTYQTVVLENEYLRITLLPELGGRIYQVIFKPTGNNELYQNPVVKPSPWGPPEQGGWLAAGGIEWGLPVEEHGYAWGDRWGHIILPFNPDYAGVTVFMPNEGHLRAEVDIMLRSGEAAFTVQPRIVNPTGQTAAYKFWLDAMVAPGPANSVGPELRLVFPGDQVTVHSRGDDTLPAPREAMTWPTHRAVDYSRLGNWSQFLGFFERPAAHGPFAGVYDEQSDEGIARVFPPAATRGSKGFGLGWSAPLAPSNYTDDSSSYFELHGGVAPTFWDQAQLPAGETYTWQETWFPVAGIGGLSYADGNGAVYLRRSNGELQVGIFPVRQIAGRVVVAVDGQPVLDEAATLSPAQPFYRVVSAGGLPATGRVQVTLFDAASNAVLNYAH